jgi:hypothetical protein
VGGGVGGAGGRGNLFFPPSPIHHHDSLHYGGLLSRSELQQLKQELVTELKEEIRVATKHMMAVCINSSLAASASSSSTSMPNGGLVNRGGGVERGGLERGVGGGIEDSGRGAGNYGNVSLTGSHGVGGMSHALQPSHPSHPHHFTTGMQTPAPQAVPHLPSDLYQTHLYTQLSYC